MSKTKEELDFMIKTMEAMETKIAYLKSEFPLSFDYKVLIADGHLSALLDDVEEELNKLYVRRARWGRGDQ